MFKAEASYKYLFYYTIKFRFVKYRFEKRIS